MMTENQVNQYIIDNIDTIMSIHTPFTGPFTIIPEFRLSNNIRVDIAVLDSNNRKLALFESKKEGADIHSVLTAIGQTTQYLYHVQNNILYNDYHPDCKVFFSTGINTALLHDWSTLKFYDGVRMLLIDEITNTTAEYNMSNNRDIERLNSRYGSGLNFMSISPFYFRDNRLSEYYLMLKIIYQQSAANPSGKLSRTTLLEPIYISANPITPGNARNTFITLSNLGFIDTENRLTSKGYEMTNLCFTDFCKKITYDYIYPYISNVMYALIEIAQDNNENLDSITLNTLNPLKSKLENIWNGKEIQFLTDSGNRYVSHWLNVLRDDLGAISFNSGRNKIIKINYLPLKGLPFKINQIPEGPEDRTYSFLYNWLNSNNIPGAC